jgi:hypothetical protein
MNKHNIVFLLILFLVSYFANAQEKISAIHFGLQYGNFYQESDDTSIKLGMHSASNPLMIGYDFYPISKLGFRLTGYYSKLGNSGFLNPIELRTSEGFVTRSTEIIGFKYSAKYWLSDFSEDQFNIGFEVGFGALNHKFYTSYRVNSNFLSEEIATNKVLFPFHLGASVIAFRYFEIGVLYNLYPFLGDVNDDFVSPTANVSFQNPSIKRSFISLNVRAFVPWTMQ